MKCSDASGEHTVTLFDEIATRVIGMTADNFATEHCDDRDKINDILTSRQMKWELQCKWKKEEFNDQGFQKLVCLRANNIDFVASGKDLLNEIQKSHDLESALF